MRIACLVMLVACVDPPPVTRERVYIDATVDVSARDRASISVHCYGAPACDAATLYVKLDDATPTQLDGLRGEVAIPPGAHAISVQWTDGFDTLGGTTVIPAPIEIARPTAGARVVRPGTLDVEWRTQPANDYIYSAQSFCGGISRGISGNVLVPATSIAIDLAIFAELPAMDCPATLGVANRAYAQMATPYSSIIVRTESWDSISYLLDPPSAP